MSYLFPEGSTTERGVVEVGSNIDVLDGIISIPQSVAPTAAIVFDELEASTALTLDGKSVITTIAPAAGAGISITALTDVGPDAGFTVNNTGVLSLAAGQGITLSGSTGNITVSTTGADFLNTVGVTANYTAAATDEYIGVDSTSLVTVTLPIGVNGRQFIVKEEHGSGTGKVNVQGSNNEKIDNSPFKQLTANASLTVVFRAGQWRII